MLPAPGSLPSAFTPPEQRNRRLVAAAASAGAESAAVRTLGQSEEGRDILSVRLGYGPAVGSLISGSHADEPVGSETLLHLVEEVARRPADFESLLEAWTLHIVCHVNPDGEAQNWPWIQKWPSLERYLTDVRRELPGRDVEFGYPDLRIENQLIAGLMGEVAPISLHMSLHGMGFSDGAMLLIDRFWAFRTEALRKGFTRAAREAGLKMHDHNRKGEKGFFQIEPGFTTTPEGAAMRAFFKSKGDTETAGRFRDSSMEFARQLGGDPLCVVTELPLFVVSGPRSPGVPSGYLAFRTQKAEAVAAMARGEDPTEVLAELPAEPLPLDTAIGLQWRAIALSLSTARPQR